MSIKNGTFLSRMRRYPADGWIAGVCAGLAVHFDWNVKLLRLLFALGLFFSGFFPVGLVYCLLWYLMAEAGGRAPEAAADSSTPPFEARSGAAPAATMSDVKLRFARLEERLRGMEECVVSRDFELRRELRKLEG